MEEFGSIDAALFLETKRTFVLYFLKEMCYTNSNTNRCYGYDRISEGFRREHSESEK